MTDKIKSIDDTIKKTIASNQQAKPLSSAFKAAAAHVAMRELLGYEGSLTRIELRRILSYAYQSLRGPQAGRIFLAAKAAAMHEGCHIGYDKYITKTKNKKENA